jgi:hypothetical protein
LRKVITKIALIARIARATITKVAATAPFFFQKPEEFTAADTGVEVDFVRLEGEGWE